MSAYNIVLSQEESTVVTEYEPISARQDGYQSEAALEAEFIRLLGGQGYTYLEIHDADALARNLRAQLERLNDYTFTEAEWQRFFTQNIANANEGIVEKTRKIQEDYIQNLRRDDGTTKNIRLIDKTHVQNNTLQVINQYAEGGGSYANRYDVTILVNGLPLVHVELKRRGVAIREAFNQIDRYQRESFWAGSGLYEYVQIFIISNGTHTKYYSNTTRFSAVKERTGKRRTQKTSNSFEFTSYWADAKNRVIADLVDFTKTFFARHTLLNILTRYCVFTSEDLLLVMRPYQIAATERILNKIEIATNYRKYGSVEGGGYIWHTTGSGKTLTSFKTAQLAAHLTDVDKVIFVVDRKDLDYQTMKEYDRFEKGAANGNRNTAILQRQLEDRDAHGNPHPSKIIVTTIQKLDRFIGRNTAGHAVYNKHVVLIFDECHRSQFGDMHARIVKYFRRYHIFGFTGTPIFAANAGSGGRVDLRTTGQAFGERLHTYTIVDAINDGNVLPFRIDYVNTVRAKDDVRDAQVEGILTEQALLAPERIRAVTSYIIDHFDQKTKRTGASFTFQKLVNIAEVVQNSSVREEKVKTRMTGFNSIFAVASIDAAKRYYAELRRRAAEHPETALRVALIYSYAANEEEGGVLGEENSDDTEGLEQSSREFLADAIEDYNRTFGTAFDTSAEKFPNYYKDLSLRMKNREIDILIVVNMFLTGFDATTLNTLWVDKNLRMHGLIQAFSRTNRILNAVKTFGNIVCFRNLQEETDAAIALFGDKEAGGTVLLKSYRDYYDGYADADGREEPGYAARIAELVQKFPLGQPIVGESAQKEFITAFGAILRLRNILSSFDDFAGNEILAPIDFQDYTGTYNDLYDLWRRKPAEKDSINDDIVFEMELVRQVEVNIDYILMLVVEYRASHCEDKDVLRAIDRAVKSSPALRSKRELIEQFIRTVNVDTNVRRDWQAFAEEQREHDLAALIEAERLKPEETRKFAHNAFRDGELRTAGTDIDEIMPPISRFGGARAEKKRGIVEKLRAFFDKYFGLGLGAPPIDEPSAENVPKRVQYVPYAEQSREAADREEGFGRRS